MDLNDARSWITLWSLLVFLGIVAWAWSAGRRRSFDEAAQLPLEDDAAPRAPGQTPRSARKEPSHE